MVMIRKRTASTAPIATNLSDIAWEEGPAEFTRRCTFVHIYGDTGTGRTTLALTAPGPIGLAHAAEKIDGIVQRAVAVKKVRVVNFGGTFRGDAQTIADQAGPVWNRLAASWYDAIDNWASTVIMDTDTEGWELLRLARFGELNPKGRTDSLYGPVNAEWRSMFKHFLTQQRCNVISIGQSKEEYIDKVVQGKLVSQRTGRTIRAGQKQIPILADVVLRTGRMDDGGFNVIVEKGWFNAHSEGMAFEGDDCNFPNIMSLITETDASEWS